VSPLRDLTAEMFDKNLWTQCPADASSPGIDIARKEQFQNLQDCFEALDSVYQGSPAAQVGTPEPLVTPESTLGRLDMSPEYISSLEDRAHALMDRIRSLGTSPPSNESTFQHSDVRAIENQDEAEQPQANAYVQSDEPHTPQHAIGVQVESPERSLNTLVIQVTSPVAEIATQVDLHDVTLQTNRATQIDKPSPAEDNFTSVEEDAPIGRSLYAEEASATSDSKNRSLINEVAPHEEAASIQEATPIVEAVSVQVAKVTLVQDAAIEMDANAMCVEEAKIAHMEEAAPLGEVEETGKDGGKEETEEKAKEEEQWNDSDSSGEFNDHLDELRQIIDRGDMAFLQLKAILEEQDKVETESLTGVVGEHRTMARQVPAQVKVAEQTNMQDDNKREETMISPKSPGTRLRFQEGPRYASESRKRAVSTHSDFDVRERQASIIQAQTILMARSRGESVATNLDDSTSSLDPDPTNLRRRSGSLDDFSSSFKTLSQAGTCTDQKVPNPKEPTMAQEGSDPTEPVGFTFKRNTGVRQLEDIIAEKKFVIHRLQSKPGVVEMLRQQQDELNILEEALASQVNAPVPSQQLRGCAQAAAACNLQ